MKCLCFHASLNLNIFLPEICPNLFLNIFRLLPLFLVKIDLTNLKVFKEPISIFYFFLLYEGFYSCLRLLNQFLISVWQIFNPFFLISEPCLPAFSVVLLEPTGILFFVALIYFVSYHCLANRCFFIYFPILYSFLF